MHGAIATLSEMLAIGFGLPRDTFTQLTACGPHLLAPTGSDMEKYGKVGTVLAGKIGDRWPQLQFGSNCNVIQCRFSYRFELPYDTWLVESAEVGSVGMQ